MDKDNQLTSTSTLIIIVIAFGILEYISLKLLNIEIIFLTNLHIPEFIMITIAAILALFAGITMISGIKKAQANLTNKSSSRCMAFSIKYILIYFPLFSVSAIAARIIGTILTDVLIIAFSVIAAPENNFIDVSKYLINIVTLLTVFGILSHIVNEKFLAELNACGKLIKIGERFLKDKRYTNLQAISDLEALKKSKAYDKIKDGVLSTQILCMYSENHPEAAEKLLSGLDPEKSPNDYYRAKISIADAYRHVENYDRCNILMSQIPFDELSDEIKLLYIDTELENNRCIKNSEKVNDIYNYFSEFINKTAESETALISYMAILLNANHLYEANAFDDSIECLSLLNDSKYSKVKGSEIHLLLLKNYLKLDMLTEAKKEINKIKNEKMYSLSSKEEYEKLCSAYSLATKN